MVMLAALLLLVSSCNDDTGDGDVGDGPPCSSRDASACTPLYEPTWDRVHAQTIAPRCGVAGSACHAEPTASGASNGLVVTDLEATRTALIEHEFVIPGDAACSGLIIRLDTDDDMLRMPPGAQALDETERCSVAQWIENGADP